MSAFNYSNTATAQRKRILEFLRIRPLDTLTARKELDVMHPAVHVMEKLRRCGEKIQTIKIDRTNDCGEVHRVACYVLEAGTGATAPADQTGRAHTKGTGQTEHSTGGNQ